ncbi:MAG: endonuclease/exonuclease/phosphatase family protein [Muribaculaceae bacterium]|nr:endonuclease/exonuclease/phosphatase family protein [Muribaculaceae bacterium]
MRILSWNVNGVQARLEAINRLVAELVPDLMCYQKVRKKGAFLTQIPGYMGWLGIIDEGLFGGVSSYIKAGFTFDFEAQRNDMPEWLMETGCLNVIRFDQFILVNAYFPYVDLSKEQYIKDRQRWNYELHDYLVKLTKQKPVILCGDLNIVSENIDAWDGVSVKTVGCFTEWEHRDFNSLMKQTGLVDTYRFLHPEGRDYSYFFQNKPEYRLMNQGFRIDYCLMSEELLPYLTKSEILTNVTDTTNSPLLIEIDLPKYL